MSFSVELVDGVSFAPEASRILEESWAPPALRYTPEYVRWQMGFPAPRPLPSVAAFDGTEPAGFAGVTARQVRCKSWRATVGIVSFVAVRPAWRSRGVATALYRRLLAALREIELPVITFAIAGSAGERTLLRAYPEAGFSMRPLGSYPVYMGMARGEKPGSDWDVAVTDNPAFAASAVVSCCGDGRFIWSAPDASGIAHYFRDPRPRKLVGLQNKRTGAIVAAWMVAAEFRTPQGVESIATIESLLLPRQEVAGLSSLFHCAAAWPAASRVISAPSLSGFDPAALRALGIRQTGACFQGYFCAVNPPAHIESVEATNLEVI
jgi:GNAT superfamily N-acetyltransferase